MSAKPFSIANNLAHHSPSPGGDLSRLGSGERNLAEPKVAWRPSERARASQRRDEGELILCGRQCAPTSILASDLSRLGIGEKNMFRPADAGSRSDRAGGRERVSDQIHPNRESDPFSEEAIRDSRLCLPLLPGR
jgi:hypothetical protein